MRTLYLLGCTLNVNTLNVKRRLTFNWSFSLVNRQGCMTSEDMLWKLDALQSFISDLHWPEPVFEEHLDHRLKLMASDMLEAAASR